MPPNSPSNSRLPQLAVWSGYGTDTFTNRALNEANFSVSCDLFVSVPRPHFNMSGEEFVSRVKL